MTLTPAPAGSPAGAPAGTPAAAPPNRMDWRRVWVMIVVIGFCLVCGIALLSIIGYNIGPLALGIGFGAALIPVPILVAAFMWLDRYEPEPPFYLAFCFLWGAFVATLAAYGGNTGATHLLPDDVVAVFVAPFIEETMKALGPVLLLLFTVFIRKRTTFNGILDSIVFFGLSATGFAFSENILYLGGHGYAAGADQGGVAGGVTDVIAVFIGRIPLSGFAHPLFTSMTAIGVGIAVQTTKTWVRILAPIGGWLLAVTLHGSWNGMATLASNLGKPQILLYGYFAVMMPIFFAMVGFAMSLRSREGRLTQTALDGYVRLGWLSPPEVATLATMGRRRSARAWARRVGGEPGSDGMRGFQLSATQLALLRDRMDRQARAGVPVSPAQQAEEEQLLHLMSAYRSAYVGRDPQAPQAFWTGTDYQIRFPDGSIRPVRATSEPVVPIPVIRVPYPVAMPAATGLPYPGQLPYPGYPHPGQPWPAGPWSGYPQAGQSYPGHPYPSQPQSGPAQSGPAQSSPAQSGPAQSGQPQSGQPWQPPR